MQRKQRSNQLPALWLATALAACGGPTLPPPGPPIARQGGPSEPTNAPQTSDAPGSQTIPLPNGITAHLRIAPAGSDAQVQLGIFAGTRLVAPGLPALAAHVLVESSDAASGRPSMRRQLESIGGSVAIQVGLMTTWIDIRVPTNNIAEALKALRGALESTTQSRSQIERMRSDLVDSLAAKVADDPIHVIARALLQGEQGTDSYLNALLDLDPSDVSLFQSRLYRPETCLLAISAPQPLQETLLATQEPKESAIAGWRPPPPAPGKPEILNRSYESGLYWVEAPGSPAPMRVAIMMLLPDASTADAAEWLMMHACLTLDGTGGRLEQMQDEAHLPKIQWRTHIEQTADAQALVLSATASPEVAAALWQILNRARQSLVEVPPTTSELDLALKRTQLNVTLPALSDAARLRLAAKLAIGQKDPRALARRALEMADESKWDAADAATKFQETPAWMVVVGPTPAPELPGVTEFAPLPRGFMANTSAKPTPQTVATTGPWLTKARAAVGGEETLKKLVGFRATAELSADQAPSATDSIQWMHPDTLKRNREILGQVITTPLAKKQQTESLDKVKTSLTPRETRLLRHEMMRHPLMLLAMHASGRVHFRTIAQRKSGDRELIVLEALGKEFDRLRIHIDTESYLIRIVESWEHLPDDTLVHLHETWSDYREAGPVRAPHRLRTMWNDGEHQTETVFSEWLPVQTK